MNLKNKVKNINSNSIGYAMIFITGLLWGTIGIFVKQMSLGGAGSMLISYLRVFFAFAVMLVITLIRSGIKSLKITPRQILQCALLGIVCQGIYNIFYSYAVVTVGVSISAVLLNIAPVFTLIVSAIFFSERINVCKMTSLLINVIGCTLTVTGGRFDIKVLSAAGILCGIGAGISYGMTAIFGKLAVNEADPFVTSTYSYFFASLILLIPAKPWSISGNIDISKILIAGLLLAVIPTAIAYLLYYKGISCVKETSKVPIIASGETIVAALLGMIIYNEQLGLVGWIGIVLVIASIALMNIK